MPATEAIPIRAHYQEGGVAAGGTFCSESLDDFSHSIDTLSDMTPIERVTRQNSGEADLDKSRENDLPIEKMYGESVECCTDTVNGYLYLTQYRIIIINESINAIATIPLLAVDSIEPRDVFILIINCKSGRTFKVTAKSSEIACEWFKKLMQKTCSPRSVSDIFAWRFAEYAKKKIYSDEKASPCWLKTMERYCDVEADANEDFERLEFSRDPWRKSTANKDYQLCETYPETVIVPEVITDDQLKSASEGRFLNRFPAVVWRCKGNGSVLLRSSQPRVGLFSYRYVQDELILESVRRANPQGNTHSTLLIVDARSYTAAFANRAKGGGFESAEYYRQTEVQFMGLPNIHNIRYSFNQLRALLSGPRDQSTFLQSLQTTQWLHYLSSLIDVAQQCVTAMCDDGRSVLVHCSDGWDRTTQIVSLAKLIADPYYRTIPGFIYLIRREWIDFGHKFADRNGVRNGDPNERSPVFLQWLDCVHQLQNQFPTAFQFTRAFLTKLAQHCYSGMFGTFLWNSLSEKGRMTAEMNAHREIKAETLSVWDYLNELRAEFVNVVYEEPNKNKKTERLRAYAGVEHMIIWKDLYIGPAVEQRINAPDETHHSIVMGLGTSQHSEADRGIYRAHSAESLTSNDMIASQSNCNQPYGTSFAPTPTLNATRSSIPSDIDPNSSTSTSKHLQPHHNSLLTRELDADGLTRMVNVFQEQARKRIDVLEKMKRQYEQRIKDLERENKQYKSAEPSPSNVSRSFGDENSESGGSRSVDSTLSGVSLIEKDDTSDISDGSKGWLVDSASPNCMNCQQPFYFNNRKHHCRSCGKLFCGKCTSFTYHRVQDNKGEQVRVCHDCYMRMSRATDTRDAIMCTPNGVNIDSDASVNTITSSSSSSTTQTASHSNAKPTNNTTSTHESPHFIIGSGNGQPVFG